MTGHYSRSKLDDRIELVGSSLRPKDAEHEDAEQLDAKLLN
jgi:hypothetical protein